MRYILFGLAAIGCSTGLASAQPKASTGSAYAKWLKVGGNAGQVALFESRLEAQGLKDIIPTDQILRTAMSWKQCGAQFELPDEAKWDGMFATLRVLKEEVVPITGELQAVSGYRNPSMNACAGGAKSSVHIEFGALDLIAVDPHFDERTMIDRLCQWHASTDPSDAIGFGYYGNRKLHIDVDVKSKRHWGKGGRRATSPCLRVS